MENQHRQIKGYRELSQQEINLMNDIKAEGIVLTTLLEKLEKAQGVEVDRRWMAIGKTHLQEGLMALTRSVARPEFF